MNDKIIEMLHELEHKEKRKKEIRNILKSKEYILLFRDRDKKSPGEHMLSFDSEDEIRRITLFLKQESDMNIINIECLKNKIIKEYKDENIRRI